MNQNLKLKCDRNMGDNLRTLREQHGLSQEKLCALLQLNSCDIGRSTYAKYEAGELNIPISMITTLRKLYQCTYDDFFVGLESSMEHNEIYRLLGNNISYYRKRANMTQLDLAEKIGISRTHMSNIEAPNVPTPFTTTVLFRIADVLGVEVKQLFDFGRISQE